MRLKILTRRCMQDRLLVNIGKFNECLVHHEILGYIGAMATYLALTFAASSWHPARYAVVFQECESSKILR